MVVEIEALPFFPWLVEGLLGWLLTVGTLAVAGVLVGWLVAAVRNGPLVAARITGQAAAGGMIDLVRMSGRRIWALSWLAVRESIRLRVIVVFVVFVLVLMFAALFLDRSSTHPARLYLSFVLTATNIPVWLLALLLSTLSLPTDIKSRTLHTVVTKPVRRSEVVLGRMLGFTAIGTLLLVVMGVISYVFVVRGLLHTHELEETDVERAEKVWQQQTGDDESPGLPELRTKPIESHSHRHQVYIDARGGASGKDPSEQAAARTGRVRTNVEQGHWHELSYEIAAQPSGDRVRSRFTYEVSPPRGRLVARVPVYGKLRFTDRSGNDAEKGINVGDEWTYRSFIAGGTLATAIWTFEGITEAKFPDGLPLELTLEVFRTLKGDTEDPETIPGIPGSLSVRNPKTGETVEAKIFTARDFTTDFQYIPRGLGPLMPDGSHKYDLFEDLVADGQVEILLRCVEQAQHFGVAQADAYLRARDASFALNLAKGYLGIWLQMVLVIGIGVMFSTFLSGPIAMIATLGVLVGGIFSPFLSDLGAGQVVGGGPTEAFVRLITQENVITPLEPGMRRTMVEMSDTAVQALLRVAAAALPDFGRFSFASHVAHGFDVSPDTLLRCFCRAVAYLLPLFVAGYFFFKMREVAK